jgi:hypothetical protein
MKRTLFALAVAVLMLPLAANATTISYVSGPASLLGYGVSGTGASGDPWLLTETFTGVGPLVLRIEDPTGAPPLGPGNPTTSGHVYGKWFSKYVMNNTSIPWTSFELELQSVLGTPSTDGDGLSFAQGSGLVFFSNVFPTYTRIDITRDYLNFNGATVLPGQSVLFNFVITDNSTNNPFWLVETPNKADVPEPASLLLLGTGLAAVARRLRKR